MNTYRIQHKVKTLSQLSFGDINGTKIEINGYKIENRGFSIQKGPYGDAWIVEKNIEASDRHIALNIFRKDFNIIAQRLGFIGQCYFDFLDQSFLVQKLYSIEKEFLLFDIRDREPVGLHFTSNEFDIYKKLENSLIDNPCFMYLQACNNTVGYHARLSLLCSALEALAGKEEKEDINGHLYTTYNKDIMKLILGDSYYNKIFGEGGLRHKIQHGDFIKDFNEEDYVNLIYKKILVYFNNEYCLNLNLDVVSPQRHFYGNLEYVRLFLKPKDDTINVDLRDIPENIEDAIRKEDCPFLYENRNSDGY